MARYELIWRSFAGAVATLGVVLELVTHPISTVVALAAVSVGVSVCVGLGTRVGEPSAVNARAVARQIIRAALLGVTALTALVGLATLGLGTMVFVAAFFVATSPQFASRVLHLELPSADRVAADVSDEWRFGGPVEVEREPPSITVGELAAADVREMGTRDLVRDWRRSYVALEQALDPVTKMALVEARQAFLDELERRNPSGLQEWLESGARAAGDPTKFMAADDRKEPGDPHAA